MTDCWLLLPQEEDDSSRFFLPCEHRGFYGKEDRTHSFKGCSLRAEDNSYVGLFWTLDARLLPLFTGTILYFCDTKMISEQILAI